MTGDIRLRADGFTATRVTLRQMPAPDTPVPRLLHGLVRGFVEREAGDALKKSLQNVNREIAAA